MTKYKKYRIVRDNFAGYEAQVWTIWWPFWCQLGFTNTHRTVEAAKEYIFKRREIVWKSE